MKIKARWFLIGLMILSTLMIPIPAQAEGESVVYEQESLSNEIRQLTIQYRGELEEYRQLENLYSIAKDQYLSLGTLASLEDAVQKTQEAMMARAKILRTYLRLLRLNLLSQPGIELNDKETAEQSLLAAIQQIEQHQQEFNDSLDKVQLNEIAVNFEDLSEQAEEAAYQTLDLLMIGRLQTIYDQSVDLKLEMEAKLATAGGALEIAERRRSFEETQRLLDSIAPEFDEVEEKFNKLNTSGYKGVYGSINDQLENIHVALSKAVEFLAELLKI